MRYVVADDLTGACEAALAYTKRGVRAVAWLDASLGCGGDAELLAAETIAIDLDSRKESPAQAHARTAALLHRLRLRKPSEIVHKIDSTLRGNAGAELRALLEYFANAVALVAPSLPAQVETVARN